MRVRVRGHRRRGKRVAAHRRVVRTRHMKPRGARGRAAVKRLGRTYRTGTFERIAKQAARRYGSAERGRRVAGRVYWNMVRARRRGRR